MNEHEASVANKITAKGSPLWTVLAIRAMQKANTPKAPNASIAKRVAVTALPSAVIAAVARHYCWL
ncbi:MAG TPA: hypothetical protein VNJ10_14495 [Sphingomonas sp.]|nr:hypothetical protein [Sphingomonas sp.]